MTQLSNPAAARGALEDVRTYERRARSLLSAFAFPLVLFGLLSMVSAAFAAERAGLFWAFAGPLGGVATAVFSARRNIGIERPWWPYWLTAALLMAGAVAAASLVKSDNWRAPAADLAVAGGYLGFAWIERSLVVVGVAVAIAAACIGFGLAGAGESAALPLLIGATLAVTGAVAWWWGRSR